MSISNNSDNTFFDDQYEAWFEGGMEWYLNQNPDMSEEDLGGIPGDFDPYVFWAEQETL